MVVNFYSRYKVLYHTGTFGSSVCFADLGLFISFHFGISLLSFENACVRIRPIMAERLDGEEHSEHSCVFCGIVAGKVEASRIRDTHNTASFVSLEGNPIVIPKKHIITPDEDPVLASEVFADAIALIPYVSTVFGTSDYNILANTGKKAGQQVPHFHVHILPRAINDNLLRIKHIPPLPREFLDSLASQMNTEIALSTESNGRFLPGD